jgi:hypothetical protein
MTAAQADRLTENQGVKVFYLPVHAKQHQILFIVKFFDNINQLHSRINQSERYPADPFNAKEFYKR